MATHLNTKLPVFICPYPKPQALAVDSMTVSWEGFGVAYIFSPMALFRDDLTRLRDMCLTMILVALVFRDLLTQKIKHKREYHYKS